VSGHLSLIVYWTRQEVCLSRSSDGSRRQLSVRYVTSVVSRDATFHAYEELWMSRHVSFVCRLTSRRRASDRSQV